MTIERAAEALETALREIGEFAAAQSGLAAWSETFAKAAESLGANAPAAPYHPDILPPRGYSSRARQLLAAAVGAFVFGGMGSWNDLGFAERKLQERYERLTKELYAAVMGGLVAAVNRGVSAGD